MVDEVASTGGKNTSVDFSYQFNMAKEKVERKIFAYLNEVSAALYKNGKKLGILVVLGSFGDSSGGSVGGMRRLGKDHLQTYINVMFVQFKDEVLKLFNQGSDGAIIVSEHGQVLGNQIYLTVDNPSLDIPEGAGTRHISAASFSCRDDVIATFTLSEETLVVRMWKDGAFIEQFNPAQSESE